MPKQVDNSINIPGHAGPDAISSGPAKPSSTAVSGLLKPAGYPAPYPCSLVTTYCWHNCHYCVNEYLTE